MTIFTFPEIILMLFTAAVLIVAWRGGRDVVNYCSKCGAKVGEDEGENE